MAATAEKMEALVQSGKSGVELWRRIEPTDMGAIKRMVTAKYGNLTRAAQRLEIDYQRLSDAINGRRQVAWIVQRIQRDLELSDADVLRLWPLLRRWPR
jgi:hypothetical protein